MGRVSEVAEDVFQIHPELNLMFSLSYLVTGEKLALIDPGSTAQAEIVLSAIEEEIQIDPASISYIIPTHLHLDHGGGAGYAASKIPYSKVLVHERYAEHLIDPATLNDAFKQTFGADFAARFGSVLPVSEDQVFKVEDGDTIDLGDRQLEVIHTRGHANHHFCLHDSKTGGLFCGDTLGMYYPDVDGIVIICPEGFDLESQLETIEKVRKLSPETLFYAHEGIGHNPDELMRRAAQELRDCGEIVQRSLKAEDDASQTEHHLNNYFQSNVSTELNYRKMYLELTAAGYRRYYEKVKKTVSGRQN